MPIQTLPAIDQNICGQWTQDDLNLYAKLPYYFVKATAEYQQRRSTWNKLLKSINWQRNQGPEMRYVGVEDSPILRQFAFPSALDEQPTADILHVDERVTAARLRRHRFVSPHFHFLPSFQDFIRDKITPYRTNINRQIEIYTEQFYRGYMWNHAPYVYIAGYGMIDAPVGEFDLSSGKTLEWLATEVVPKVSSNLTFAELFKCLHSAEDEIGCTPYDGSLLNNNWSAPMDGKFALIGQNEVWNQFINDPWVKENRPIDMNIITDGLRGEIFNRIRFRAEYYGPRILVAEDGTVSFPAPEAKILTGSQKNRTVPNPEYSREAQLGIAWLVGGPNYNIIKVGPPPEEFAGKSVDDIMGMDWNGRIRMTHNFLIPCKDADGKDILETNSWGEYLRLQAEVVMGIAGYNTFNVIPIVYRRKNTIETVS